MSLTSAERSAFQQDPCLPGHPDPYPIYTALCAESPVQWCEGPQMWVILGHPEAVAHRHDPRCSRQRHLDKLIDRFGTGHLFHGQKLDIPYMDGVQHAQVRHYVTETFRGITQTEKTTEGGDDAIAMYRRFFLPLIQERRAHPQNDLLSRLMVNSHDGRPISDEQLLLFISSNFYSASVFTLRLRSDGSLLDFALEEVVRWDPPAQAVNASAATEPIELAGHTIAAGDSLTALVGAENRDPRVFGDPQIFRIERDPNPHLSFAQGLHQCLGRQLARLQGRAVLEALRERFRAIHWQEEASHRFVGDRFRGFERLTLVAV